LERCTPALYLRLLDVKIFPPHFAQAPKEWDAMALLQIFIPSAS
jgi:hypothetical protein